MNNIPEKSATTPAGAKVSINITTQAEYERLRAAKMPKPTLKDTIEDHQWKLFRLAALLKCLAGIDEGFGAELVHDMRMTIGDAASTASTLAGDIYEWDINFPKISEQEVVK